MMPLVMILNIGDTLFQVLFKSVHILIFISGAAAIALVINRGWTPTDYLWSFSIWLEAVAIFPQLRMLAKIKEVPITENINDLIKIG